MYISKIHVHVMASSADQKPHGHLPVHHGATTAPPPTPSTQSNLTSESTEDAISRLLHRLPCNLSLSLPTRGRSSPLSSTTTSVITPPVISLSDPSPTLHPSLLSASQEQGFFQLIHHLIPSHLPPIAETTSISLFDLPHHQKRLLFPNNWPLGFNSPDDDDDDDNDDTTTNGSESFCLDLSCSNESTTESNLDLASLRELTSQMEKLGLKVMEELASAAGFENPARDDPSRVRSLMWISNGPNSSRIYPYVIGLHYQIRCQQYSLLSDSGWIHVSPQVDSVLVTLGDIAQVWSNGKFKKVRGRALPVSGDDKSSMSLLITLPIESTVSALIPKLAMNGIEEKENEDDDCCSEDAGEEMLFHSFSFEDYAWRVYHERLFRKDPLLRYRI
ncbi:gibberellin 2-beta-dioxygenase 4 [Olea europaea var. sylvestris]|uniref:gibberellin 2-beta-dioxygenase 4 n=1 Tax=Olea europaea var. sylvestris TaxID=158386 RepID=UPI000C1CE610|nr:gibberellin 2-beta-dioxygenase 4 [Olea europaea var. sylvestris]